MKVLSWSTMCVHDVVGKSAVYCPHLNKLLNTFMKKQAGLSNIMMWNVNLECAEQLTFHIHDKSFKFEWIRL
jgi:hypothetical protein